MKRFCQSAVALLLSLALLASAPLSAAAVTVSVTPIIYIADMDDIDLYKHPNILKQSVVFDTDSTQFRNACIRMISALAFSSDTGASGAVPEIVSCINTIFSPIACSASGKSKDADIGALRYDRPLAKYANDVIDTPVITAIADAVSPKVDRNHFYVFLYDWRMDPMENGAQLKQFIDKVLTDCHADSVSLIAAGYGGVVASAYLYGNRTHAAQSVYSCVMLDSPLMGNALMGDIMKGKLTKTAADNSGITDNFRSITGKDRGDALLRYVEDDPNNIITSLTQSILGGNLGGQLLGVMAKLMLMEILRNEGSPAKLAKLYNNFVLLEGDTVYDQCLREYLRTMPGLWALVPTQDYAAAVEFLYGDEIMDYEFSVRLSNARAVTDNAAATLKYAKASGIRMYVVANYGRQILPGTVSIDDLSDGIESTKYASAGAVTLDCGKGWPIQRNCTNDDHNHRAPDDDIEASTCALPENTWFIKDLKHMDFQYKTTAELLAWMVLSSTQRSVWETEEYPQYLIYDKSYKKISPYSSNAEMISGNYRYGDTDQDGAVTSADARTVLRYSVQLETPTSIMWIVADVDGDGEILPADARLVLRYSVALISRFPVEE